VTRDCLRVVEATRRLGFARVSSDSFHYVPRSIRLACWDKNLKNFEFVAVAVVVSI
jgi:hypothetical protein